MPRIRLSATTFAVCCTVLLCLGPARGDQGQDHDSPADAPSEVEAPAEEPFEEESYSRTLRWSTASEVDNFGFDVYRGDSEEGPFERLTETPIEGAGTTDLTTRYSFEDDTIDPYRTYYYYVESISLTGVREQFTPVITAKPKLPAEGETEAGEDDNGDEGESGEDEDDEDQGGDDEGGDDSESAEDDADSR